MGVYAEEESFQSNTQFHCIAYTTFRHMQIQTIFLNQNSKRNFDGNRLYKWIFEYIFTKHV